MSGRSRRLSIRARSVFLWGTGFFLAIQLAGGVLLDYAWVAARFPSAYGFLGQLDHDPRPVAIVCLGSSRVGAGMDTIELAETLRHELHLAEPLRVLNAAVPAGDLISADYMLEQLIRHGHVPRFALIEVNPETLNRCNEWYFFHVRRQLLWEDIPRHLLTICRSGQFGRLVAARLLPLHVHRREMADDLLRRLTPPAPHQPAIEAWLGEPPVASAAGDPPADRSQRWQTALRLASTSPSPRQRELTATGAGQPYRWLRCYKIGGGSAEALDRLLVRCQRENITPILIAMPVAEAHRAAYTPAIESEFRAYMNRTAADHRCVFVDWRDRLADSLFMDNHHMSSEGSCYFSRLLAQEVLVPAWQERYQTTSGSCTSMSGSE